VISVGLRRRYYPDDRPDTTEMLYGWIREHVTPASVVLNLGAGPASGVPVKVLRGEVARLVGADIDPVVTDNDEIDEACVVAEGRLPFADDSFDLVFSDFVLEHLRSPESFLKEARRVLKSGASFFFRTPSRYHYVCIVARFTPHRFHEAVANRARGFRPGFVKQHPTFYRMNDRRRIARVAREAGFRHVELRFRESLPAYLSFHPAVFLAGVAWERVVNRFEALSPLRANILGRLLK